MESTTGNDAAQRPYNKEKAWIKHNRDAMKKAAGIEAAKLVHNGMIAGLGNGSTVRFLVDELGRRVQEEGLQFTGVTTSRRTQEQAESFASKIVDIDDADHIDVPSTAPMRSTRTSRASRRQRHCWGEDRGDQFQQDRLDRRRIRWVDTIGKFRCPSR